MPRRDRRLALVPHSDAMLGANLEVLALGGAVARGVGNGLANMLVGNAGTNTLFGLAGNDSLAGMDGNDILIGGGGADRLTGGGNNDQFRLASLADSTLTAPDVITDFAVGGGQTDRISLALIDANSLVAGNQAFHYRGSDFSGSAGDLRAVSLGGGSYRAEGDVNGDGAADFAIVIKSATAPVAG